MQALIAAPVLPCDHARVDCGPGRGSMIESEQQHLSQTGARVPTGDSGPDWYALGAAECLAALGSSPGGLDAAEVARRQARWGLN